MIRKKKNQIIKQEKICNYIAIKIKINVRLKSTAIMRSSLFFTNTLYSLYTVAIHKHMKIIKFFEKKNPNVIRKSQMEKHIKN